MPNKIKVVEGDKFGEWTIIREAEIAPDGTHRRFLCRCVCGNESVVQFGHLQSGHSNGCWKCGVRASGMKREKDYTGIVIGKLTFINRIYTRKGNWRKAKCECGAEVEVAAAASTDERVVACRRCTKEMGNSRKNLISDKKLLYRVKQMAKARSIIFDESIGEFLIELINSSCYYCGNPPKNGIDRIDSSRGYVSGNIRSCCMRCNTIKMDATEEDFYSHCKKIVELQEGRINEK